MPLRLGKKPPSRAKYIVKYVWNTMEKPKSRWYISFAKSWLLWKNTELPLFQENIIRLARRLLKEGPFRNTSLIVNTSALQIHWILQKLRGTWLHIRRRLDWIIPRCTMHFRTCGRAVWITWGAPNSSKQEQRRVTIKQKPAGGVPDSHSCKHLMKKVRFKINS